MKKLNRGTIELDIHFGSRSGTEATNLERYGGREAMSTAILSGLRYILGGLNHFSSSACPQLLSPCPSPTFFKRSSQWRKSQLGTHRGFLGDTGRFRHPTQANHPQSLPCSCLRKCGRCRWSDSSLPYPCSCLLSSQPTNHCSMPQWGQAARIEQVIPDVYA